MICQTRRGAGSPLEGMGLMHRLKGKVIYYRGSRGRGYKRIDLHELVTSTS